MASICLPLATEPALVVYLVGLALSIGLAVASQALARKGKRDPNQPIPTTVLQGGFVPRVIGRRRIAPLVGAVGHRYVTKQRSGSGKNKGPATYTYYESAWHLLCVGPAYAIHRVWVDGQPLVWGGAISSDTTPSGSFVPAGATGGFYIYWGEENQPPSPLVESLTAEAAPASGGVVSGYPFFCYVVWQSVTLGAQPIWPQIEYEIEVRPQALSLVEQVRETPYTPYLFSDPDWAAQADAEVTLTAESEFQVDTTGVWEGDNVAPPDPSGSNIEPPMGSGSNICRIFVTDPNLPLETYSGDISSVVVKLIGPSAQEIELLNETSLGIIQYWDNQNIPAGWTAADVHPTTGQWLSIYMDLDLSMVDFDETGTWTLRAELTSDWSSPPPGDHGEVNHLSISAVLDLAPDGAVGPPADSWIEDGDQIGANPADAYYELMTFPFPHGAGVDETDLDTVSLGDWHDYAVAQVLPANIYAANGELTGDILGQIATDHGMFLSYNPNPDCGKFVFQPIRSGAGPFSIEAETNVGELPEVETPLLQQPFDRIMFTYPDKDREYRETVVTIDEDGQASLLEIQKAQKSPLYTATDNVTARKLAEVKSQEDLPGNTGYRLELNRDCWQMWPGLSIEISALDPDQENVLKIIEVEDQQLTTKTRITAVADNYDADLTAYEGEAPPSSGGSSTPPVADTIARLFEVPTVLLQTRLPRVVVPRVRGDEGILGANVYLSSDGTTYEANQQVFEVYAGGTLDSELPADDPYEIAVGPTITIQGTDIDETEDLSPLGAEWRRGRQAMLIGEEIFYVQRIRPVSSTVYQLEGLIRARLGTKRATHASSSQVYIFALDDIADLSDPRVQAGVLLYCKPAPFTSAGELSLGSVTARTRTIRGNGVVPDAIHCLRVTAPRLGVRAYKTGEDVTLSWSWSDFAVPGTGAGMQNYGQATGSSPVYGTFEVRVYDDMDVLVRTENVGTTPSWTYDNADLQSDLGGETDFRVEVFNINGGFRSEATEIEIVAN